jgi:chromate transport protein ChrA
MIAAAGLGIILNALWNGNAVSLDLKSIDLVIAGLIAVLVVVLRKVKLSPSIVILGSGLVGGLIYSLI